MRLDGELYRRGYVRTTRTHTRSMQYPRQQYVSPWDEDDDGDADGERGSPEKRERIKVQNEICAYKSYVKKSYVVIVLPNTTIS